MRSVHNSRKKQLYTTKAGKVEKAEKRNRSRYSAQTVNGRDENLSVWTLKHLKLLMIKRSRWMPSSTTERLPAGSATDRLHQMSTHQCERLAAETIPEKDARFECDRARHGELTVIAVSCLCLCVPSKPRCINFMQAWQHWIYQCYFHASMATLDISVLY